MYQSYHIAENILPYGFSAQNTPVQIISISMYILKILYFFCLSGEISFK